MSDANTLPREFVDEVRNALAHLYDFAYLQNHPLANELDANPNTDRMTRAQKVRRVLLGCIKALQARDTADDHSEAARAYAILTYRYVDELEIAEITRKLTLSRSQVYREHAKGIEAIASLLWDQLRPEKGSNTSSPLFAPNADLDRLAVAEAEVDLLRNNVAIEPTSLAEVLESTYQLFSTRIRQSDIQLKLPPIAPWPPIVVDRTMLRQALLNMLSHAVDTVERGVLAISVTEAVHRLQVEIIAQPRQPRIQSSISTRREGVGLVVAQKLIEAQRGYLEMGDYGDGWRAQILLPTAGLSTAVLVVEDNPSIVTLFQRYLGGHDITVLGTTGGEKALLLAQEYQPQLVVLDIMMPNQDGWEILQQLKSCSQTQQIPVVVCSVLNEPDLARGMGASDYLTKPVSQAEFLTVLQRWLGPLQPVV